jgi:DNA-binding response OmpR family regulator
MTHILLVEDDEALALGTEYSLKNENFQVKTASNIKEAEELFNKNQFDLILLDVMLPDGKGYDFCRAIRKKSSIPIIFLTACDEEVNIVLGLDIGGDDYVTKPFRIKELVSRINAVLRRFSPQKEKVKNILSSRDIVVYILQGKVIKKDKEITLTSLEYKLLLTLMQHSLQILSRQQILDNLFDICGEFIDHNALSVYIRRLREKIEDNPSQPKYIITIRGLGYKWNMEAGYEGII